MKSLVAITIDYETWQPIPPGKRIDWDRDVFDPAARLMETAESAQARITFMAEMGEYFWLKAHQPQTAERMQTQWQEAIRRGHDVQLHLHPVWLPELGARCEEGRWCWDESQAKADEYPGDLTALIARCKQELEQLLKPIDPAYQAVAFRAGAYQVQPFRRLWKALVANGIIADTSVYAGGVSDERGYDFRLAYSHHQPYFANSYDPQLKAPPSESQLVELPVFTPKQNQRWFLDNDEARHIADRLADFLHRGRKRRCERSYPLALAIEYFSRAYQNLAPWRRQVNRILPRRAAYWMTNYHPERLVESDYFVMIGHTKADLEYGVILDQLRRMKASCDVRYVTLSAMARTARKELQHSTRPSAVEEAAYQVQREYRAVMGDVRNAPQSYRLQEMVPLDRSRLLDLGCGAGYWSERLARLYPWVSVTGIDCGRDFIDKANAKYASAGCHFLVEDFADLSFDDETFDCIYADNTLEHAFDVGRTLSEAHRILTDGGVLVAAIPSDARNPACICDNHTWKTAPHEVCRRLADAGFVNVQIDEIDTYREVGMTPFPPARDRMMYLRAWKRAAAVDDLDRAREAMDWVYHRLEPDPIPITVQDPKEIIRSGHGLCVSYAIVLGSILRAEGMDVCWLNMLAEDHPRGRGKQKIDSHEAVLLRADGREVILDPTSNTWIPHPLEAVLANPDLAVAKSNPDARYRSRGYDLYSSSQWYRRVFKYRLLDDFRDGRPDWNINPFRRKGPESRAEGPEPEFLPSTLDSRPSTFTRMRRDSICILRGVTEPPPAQEGTTVVPFSEVRRDILEGKVFKYLFRYRSAEMHTSRIEVLTKPLNCAVLLRLCSRGRCFFTDEYGQRKEIRLPELTRISVKWMNDWFRVPRFLKRYHREVQSLAADLRKGGRVSSETAYRGGRVRSEADGPDSAPFRGLPCGQTPPPGEQRQRLDLQRRPVYLRTDFCFGLRSGGSVGHIAGVLNHLNAFCGEPIFLTTDRIPTVDEQIETHLILPDSAFFSFDELPGFHFNETCLAKAKTILGEIEPAFIYQRYNLNNFCGVKLSRHYGVPLVLEYNGSEVWVSRNWGRPLKHEKLSAEIEDLNVKAADLVTVVSGPLKDELIARGVDAEKILVNPNGVNTDMYSPEVDGSEVRQRYGLEGKTVIGFIGTFGKWHGAEVLAEAFGRLLRDHPEDGDRVRLLLIGDGVMMPEVRERLTRYGVEEHTVLTGLIPQQQGPSHLAACDLLASPHVPNSDGTPFFGSPTKLFEYMAMGKGIVASDLDQIGEVLEHARTAWMVEPGNVAAFQQGLQTLLDDPELSQRLGAEARRAAVAKHTWFQHTRRIIEALERQVAHQSKLNRSAA